MPPLENDALPTVPPSLFVSDVQIGFAPSIT
jgi:hypothetical protein